MTVDNKKIAQHILKAVNGEPKVIRYKDNDDKSVIDIFIGEDRPFDGVTTYSTIGLSKYDISTKTGNGKDLRVEFIGASASVNDKFANIVSSCAFNIINNGASCHPGTVYSNVVSEYYSNPELKHIMCTTPFLWEKLTSIEFDNEYVTWLMLVPISDAEFEFLKRKGSEDLEALFEQEDIDIFDLGRSSVV